MAQVKRLFDIPHYQLANYPQQDMLAAKVNGAWVRYSTQEVIEMANRMSKGLLRLGLKPGDRVGLVSNNRPEWNISDLSVLQIGAANVPVYPTASSTDYKFIFNDAGIKFCFVSGEELYRKVEAIRAEVPSLIEIYSFDKLPGVKHWTEILELGSEDPDEELESIKAAIKADDLATLIYTSGTTGAPKGVMLSHHNIVSNLLASTERLPVDSEGRALSFLPLCHVYERMLNYLYMLAGVSVYHAESIDTVGENLKEVKPHVFVAVPRVLEKVYDKIMTTGQSLKGIKRALFFWALKVAEKYEPGNRNTAWYRFKLGIARKLIFSKWQAALGGNVRVVASGAAPLQPRLARVFLAAGIPVMEGYGLTETSPVISVNCEKNDGVRIGTVGRPLSNVQVKIEADGEICCKGPNVMLGYFKRPDLTAEVIDAEGWFHTGDIGEIVEGGFLRITDRKKEIFKTSGGKYIAPQPLENKFKESRFIEQVMVIGEGQKHPAVLVVPAQAFVKEWCVRKGINVETLAEMAADAQVKDRIWQEIQTFNESFGHWEQVKKMELLPAEFSIEGGELTPTLKLKRKFILEKYKDRVQRIYGE